MTRSEFITLEDGRLDIIWGFTTVIDKGSLTIIADIAATADEDVERVPRSVIVDKKAVSEVGRVVQG